MALVVWGDCEKLFDFDRCTMKQSRISCFAHRYKSRIGNDNSDNEQNSVCTSEVSWRGIHAGDATCSAGSGTHPPHQVCLFQIWHAR